MRVAILGCGYVGKAIAKNWQQYGHFVTVTTRKLERVKELKKFANKIVLLNENSWKEFLAEQDILLISVAPDSYDQTAYFQTYLSTAQQVVKHIPPSLKQIIYTSSTSVYGEHGGAWVDEQTPIYPKEPNQHILYQTEEVLLNSLKEKICIFRLGGIYGPGRETLDRLKRLTGKSLPGTGETYTNLISLQQIVSGIDFAVRNELKGIYNLCNDLHIKRKDYYKQLCDQAQLPEPYWDTSLSNQHGGNKRVCNKKIKSLGFHFTDDLECGIALHTSHPL